MTATLHRCTKCRETKPATEFYRNPSRKPGVSSKCIPCAREHAKAASAAARAKEALKKLSEAKKVKSSVNKPKTSQKPRKCKLRPRSREKARWEQLYRLKCGSDTHFGMIYRLDLTEKWNPRIIAYKGGRAGCERHHPFRRIKWCILLYRYITPELHTWLESNATRARHIGLLFDVERGELRSPSKWDPFEILDEFKKVSGEFQI
jgi:hypothetical protein